MSKLVHPTELVRYARGTKGYDNIKGLSEADEIRLAEQVVYEWESQYPEGAGFGSSDYTFMVQDFLDYVIRVTKSNLKTQFSPLLTVTTL